MFPKELECRLFIKILLKASFIESDNPLSGGDNMDYFYPFPAMQNLHTFTGAFLTILIFHLANVIDKIFFSLHQQCSVLSNFERLFVIRLGCWKSI